MRVRRQVNVQIGKGVHLEDSCCAVPAFQVASHQQVLALATQAAAWRRRKGQAPRAGQGLVRLNEAARCGAKRHHVQYFDQSVQTGQPAR